MKIMAISLLIAVCLAQHGAAQPVTPLQAKELLPKALVKARTTFASDAYLAGVIFTPFTYRGQTASLGVTVCRATAWIYRMYSPSLARDYHLVAMKGTMGDTVLPTQGIVTVPSPPVAGNTELAEPWCESVPAILSAESGGANAFIQSHPDAIISRAFALDNPSAAAGLPQGKLWIFWFAAQADTIRCVVDAATGQSIACGPATGIASQPAGSPGLSLRCHPNPARGPAIFEYTTERSGTASIVLYDIYGRVAAVVMEGASPAGGNSAVADVSSLPAGLYVCVLRNAGRAATTVLVKM
jgi:hypothetical protein